MMNWHLALNLLPYILAFSVYLFILSYSWRRRAIPAARYFAFFILGSSIWAGVMLFSFLTADGKTNHLLESVSVVGISLMPVAWLLFALSFTGRKGWISKYVIIPLLFEPVAATLLLWNYSYLILTNRSMLITLGWLEINLTTVIGSMTSAAHMFYSMLLLLIGTMIMLAGMLRTFSIYTGQYAALLVGALTPWIANIIYFTSADTSAASDLRGIAVTISAVTTAWAVYRYQLFDAMPFARDMITESINTGVLVLNPQRQVVNMNPAAARITGVKMDEAIGQTIDAVLNCHEQIFKNLEQIKFEAEITLGEGENLRYYDLRLRPLYDQVRNIAGQLILLQDVTLHKQAEEELVKARDAAESSNRSKSTFLANMSHELRTPLNAIIGYSEMLEEDAADLGYDDFTPDLQKIRTAGRHLLDLINNVLDISKIEAGRMEVYAEKFDLYEMVSGLEAGVLPQIKKHGNTFQVNCPVDIGIVYTDMTKLRQVLFNLLSNAAKFTEQGTIALTVESAPHLESGEDWITFRIADTGIGMAPEEQERLFQPFMQADSSTTRRYGGTGLGLTISRRFCEMLGGAIELESEKGRGTLFTVSLPANLPGAEPISETPEPVENFLEKASNSAPGVVLVIDDDLDSINIVRRVVEKEGFQVESTLSSVEGLKMAKTIRPQAILLDVIMSEMDGWEVLSALKADEDLAHIPVIMHTILGEKIKGFALGASEYLTKPLDHKRLTSSLQRYRIRNGKHPDTPLNNILVVEDDPSMLELLERTLLKDNWNVTTAVNGLEALKQLEELSSDLILLDLMLPIMDGFQFLDELHGRDEWRHIPVVVFTAKTLSLDERRFLNQRVEQVLLKGNATLSGDDLLREVRQQLSSYVEMEQPK
jgi:PAS domain S-box-containing protein